MSEGTPIIQQTPPSVLGKPSVKLKLSDFNALVQGQGAEVYHDRAIKCPCSSKDGGASQSNCQNCGGAGWLYINRTQTNAVVQSMNTPTKLKEWSEERLGMAKITITNNDRVSLMDRITLIDSESMYSQVLFLKTQPSASELYGTARYDIVRIQDIFLFDTASTKLTKLEEDVDYTFTRNQVRLTATHNGVTNPTITIRYIHREEYTILDIPRDVMVANSKADCGDGVNPELFPILAMGRVSHYMPDRGNFDNTNLLDNSY